ncbi:hypothetical protein FA95DRAFT_517172 [Auriscalpium vulgare]|uniref:Uncharacterized protein n=1 Tax=Auriscalpium vulgare TaxID=40419 RepID=A0ACB8S2H8_9AGAM|nr:hypothetical protein FA95DRAFT_517172 [Auriscalpium vulgare]
MHRGSKESQQCLSVVYQTPAHCARSMRPISTGWSPWMVGIRKKLLGDMPWMLFERHEPLLGPGCLKSSASADAREKLADEETHPRVLRYAQERNKSKDGGERCLPIVDSHSLLACQNFLVVIQQCRDGYGPVDGSCVLLEGGHARCWCALRWRPHQRLCLAKYSQMHDPDMIWTHCSYLVGSGYLVLRTAGTRLEPMGGSL